jgi:uncharacterized membrane protein YgcG
MNNLYDILETCLQEIENGADVDTVLFRYPEFAEELRPILETSTQAKMLAAGDPSPDVIRRGRAQVLQQAAQMREAQARPSRRLWSVPLRRAMVSLAVIAALFISSNGLVQAASTTLPGDNLYPVKRTWEDVRVLLTFNMQEREALEVEHENKRLDELNDLFIVGRSAKVDFAGTVMSQNGDLWEVAKIPVLISAGTDLGAQPAVVGDAVRVRGFTQSGGTVLADRVDLLPAGIPLPEIDDDHAPEAGQEKPAGEQDAGEEGSGKGSGGETPKPEATKRSQQESNSREFSQSGVINSLNGDTLVVNGQSMNISGAEIKGTPKAGGSVKVEGYFDANGTYIVTKIEFQTSGSDGGGSTNDGGNKDGGNNNNSDSGNSNDNGGGGGGGDNGGSGGGGGDSNGSGGGGDD